MSSSCNGRALKPNLSSDDGLGGQTVLAVEAAYLFTRNASKWAINDDLAGIDDHSFGVGPVVS